MAKNFQRLEKIPKHPGFFRNPESQKIYWRGTIKGRTIKKSTGETQITKAKQVIEDFLLQLTAENLDRAVRERQGIKNPLLKILWDEMIDARKVDKAASTLVNYEKEWRLRFDPFFGKDNLNAVNQAWVVEFENWFLKTFPGQVYFNTGKCLRMFLNYLHAEGYVAKKYKTRKLDKAIAAQTKKKKVGRVYMPQEKDAILANAPSDWSFLALVLYFDTGARKMEILTRKWEDFSTKDRGLNIWSDKNKKWRFVPLPQKTISMLKDAESAAIDRGLGEYIFPMKTDPTRSISSQLFDKDWVDAKRAAKIKGRARVHDIRHTVATKTARDGWPIDVACRFLDMSPKIYMETYVHTDPREVAKWARHSFDGGNA